MGEEDIRPGKFFKRERRKEMKLKLERLYLKPDYTIGKLYIDGKYFCDNSKSLKTKLKDDGKNYSISITNTNDDDISGNICLKYN